MRANNFRAAWQRMGALLASTAIVGTGLLVAPAAETAVAAGTPDIALTVSMPTETLYGTPTTVTLTATNATGTDGYNLSFNDKLPPGASLVSADPAPTRTLTDGTGRLVIIWENVADLQAGTTESITYSFLATTPTFVIGNTLTDAAGAYVNTDPRFVPDFDPVSGDATTDVSGSDTDAASTTLMPFEITTSEPSPEAELLRGVHDHKTVYTLTVESNHVLPTSGFAIEDYLPAGLEFLGCAPVDNTAPGTEEYTGSGRIDATAHPTFTNGCVTPSIVETVSLDPDGVGPLPNAVYTHVVWTAADLTPARANQAAAGIFRIDYAAAVPLRQNAVFAVAPPTTGAQGSNLDNNTGPLTVDEQALTNLAVASGTTSATLYTDTGTHTVTAEDLAVQKSVDLGGIEQGAVSTWTMQIETSEYALGTTAITMVDVVPDGLCVIAAGTPCAGAGAHPSPAPASVVGAGPTTVTWNLADMVDNAVATVTMRTLTSTAYSGTNPVATNDAWTNQVSMTGTSTVIVDSAAATNAVGVVDASAAGQTAGGVTLLKEVSQPVGGTLTCGDGSAITWLPGVAATYRAGDRVCWRLQVDFVNTLDTLAVTLRDFLPAGHTFEGWQFGANNTVPPGDVGFTSTNVPPTWSVATVDAGAQVLEVVLSSIVAAPTAADGDILANLAKLSYENTAGDVFQARDQADVEMSAPIVTLVKGVADVNDVATPGAPADNVLVRAGDTVTYHVVVSNAGTLGATAMSVRDLLPTGITCADLSGIISNGGVCSSGQINWSGLSVAAGSSLTLDYDVLVPIGAAASQAYTNTAGVRQFQAATNTGTPFTYVPSSNIDGTLTPNTTPARDTSQIHLANPTIAKTRTTSVNETSNGTTVATVGETISYTLNVTVPAMTSVYNADVTDTVSARLDLLNGTEAATRDGAALPGGVTLATVGNVLTLDFGATYTNSTASNQVFAITFDAQVLDVAANDRDLGSVGNTGSFRYENQSGSPTTITSSVNTNIVEPNVQVTKTNADANGIATPGETVTYHLAITNPTGTRVSIAHDITVVDVVPVNLDPVLPIPNGGVWDPTPGVRTITWTIASVSVNATVNRPYQVTVLDPLIATESLQNTVTVRATSMPGVVSGERTSTSPFGGGAQGYLDSDTNTLQAPRLAIAKVASPTTVTLGETVTYTLDVTIPANVILNDVTVVDDPPAGMVYTGTTSSSCVQGGGACSPGINVTNLGSDGNRIGWWFDDLDTPAAANRVVTIVYTMYAASPLAGGAIATNTAVVVGNTGDVLGAAPVAPPNPASFDVTSNTATEDVAIVEPRLVIDKDVAGQVADTDQRRAVPGQLLTYTVAVTNTGSSAAYDIEVTDTPDTDLLLATVANGAGYSVVDGDPSDGTLAWAIAGPVAPGATVTITYSLQVPTGFDETDEVAGFELTNTADVPSYLGVALAAQVPGNVYPDYDNVTPDTVQVELDLASIGDRVWWDLDDDGVQDAGEPGFAGVDVSVTYLGANGIVGGGDDEAHTVTTDASGNYLVEDLPNGNYRVSVDTADLPAGFLATYDLDGGVLSPNSLWAGALAGDEAKRDVDFGYDGSGTIGDTVWFDQDGDGVIDAGEPGLAGVTVTVTWLGPDGVVGGGDDRAFVTTTDTSGSYLVDDLPAGNHAVVISTGTLPAGFTTQTGDPDATMNSASAVALAAGATNLLQDFGYGGTGSIGDRVWFDRNGDGTRDLDDDGIPGATVTLTWHGPDGVAGGGDDVGFTRITGAAGDYLFDHLPAGSFVVDVSGLPADYVNTFDEDLDLDASTPVALGNGVAHLSADFGFRGATAVGDRVWWDLDADGVQDVGEPGLAGVEVTVTYAGPNDAFGDGDDIVFVRTTDPDGDYLVTNTPEGEYRVAVTGGVPTGMTVTFDEDDGTSAPDASTALTLGVVPHLTADVGYVGTGSIGDLVFLDLDGNGVLGAGDLPLSSIDVDLTWAGGDATFGSADDITLSTTTDASGTYLFTGLPAGGFRVFIDAADLPAGVVPTADPDGGTAHTSELVLATGSDDLAQDFGYDGSGSIGDTVWLDLDGDGSRDAGEPGLGLVDVTLTWAGVDAIFGTGDDVVNVVVTDTNGTYLFDELPAGPYRVAVDATDLPPSVAPTADPDGGADHGSSLTLAAGADDLAQDFGYRGTASVGDRVWIDVDVDGMQDATEPGVTGLTVTVLVAGLDDTFGTADDLSIEVVTDTNGTYVVTGLPSGDVTVSYSSTSLAAGFTPSSDRDGGDLTTTDLTLAPGDAPRDVDFGVRGTASLSGVVWTDTDADGVQDAGETGIPGVTVTAVWAGPTGPVVLTVVTGSDGSWAITHLPPGSYTATVSQPTVPAGLVPSTPLTVSVSVPADGTAVVQHGETPSASIGDHVWRDTDRDGIADTNEPGLAGVTVRLHRPDGTVVATAVTDGAGRYLFSGLVPGTYRVVVDVTTVPVDFGQFADPDGTRDAQSTVTVGPNEANAMQDFSFGPFAPLPVTGSDAVDTVLLALELLLVGGTVLLVSRRRRRTAH